MATILPREISNYLPDSTIVFLAGKMNETEEHIRSVIRYGVLATTWIVLKRNEVQGASEILNLSRHALAAGYPDSLGKLTTTSDGAIVVPDSAFAEDLSQGQFSQLVIRISNFTRVKAVTVRAILQILAPLSLGIIGKHATVDSWKTADLQVWLSAQQAELYDSLPAGLNLSSLNTDLGSQPRDSRESPSETQIVSRKKLNLAPILAIVIVLAAIIVLFFCYKNWSVSHGDPLHLKSLF